MDSNSVFAKKRVKLAETIPPYLGSTFYDYPKYGRGFAEENYQQKFLSVCPQKLKVREDAKTPSVVLKMICNPTYSVQSSYPHYPQDLLRLRYPYPT